MVTIERNTAPTTGEIIKNKIMKSFLKKYYGYIIAWCAIFLFIIFSIYNETKKQKIMLSHYKFTVGIAGKWHHKTTWKSPGTDYFYEYKGKKYDGVFSYAYAPQGKKFLVILDSVKPSNSTKLLKFYPLPDSIKIPENGWRKDEVPISINMDSIKKYVLSW